MSKKISIDKEQLQALFDLVAHSMDYGSGFFDHDDIRTIISVAELLGVADSLSAPGGYGTSWKLLEPHLWHQECALKWRCGEPSGAPIHQVELPA